MWQWPLGSGWKLAMAPLQALMTVVAWRLVPAWRSAWASGPEWLPAVWRLATELVTASALEMVWRSALKSKAPESRLAHL